MGLEVLGYREYQGFLEYQAHPILLDDLEYRSHPVDPDEAV